MPTTKHILLWRTQGHQIPRHECKFLLGVLGGWGSLPEIQKTLGTPMYVYLDDSLKLEPARLPTRSLTAELEEATEERRGHT